MTGYLAGLPVAQQEPLERINRRGTDHLRKILTDGTAIAFLGAGASAPLYPLWNEVISELLDSSADVLPVEVLRTCKALAGNNPDAVVEIIRRHRGHTEYRELLRSTFRPRRDLVTGRTWTNVHEAVVRCNFLGVVTTNYDSGIVNARTAVRSNAQSTGFASWVDDDALDRWQTGEIFEDTELPVLFLHGQHNQPDTIVLATTEYRRAYRGKTARVLAHLFTSRQVVWLGFSFSDQRVSAILREVEDEAGTLTQPGRAPRHVAIVPWDPRSTHDPEVVRNLIEVNFGSHAVLYPATGSDHSALQVLLDSLVDPRHAPRSLPEVLEAPGVPVAEPPDERPDLWVHGRDPLDTFCGRAEELDRLARWSNDPTVKLIGVTAWGGAGKTALVTEWAAGAGHAGARAFRGLFAWSFYAANSAELWAQSLLDWVEENFGISMEQGALPTRVLAVLSHVPLLLILDGLELAQDGPAGTKFGQLLDDTLGATLTGLCLSDSPSLAVLTSRFPFADLESFDGSTARMLDVPPFTAEEGAEVLEKAGGGWLPAEDRLRLVGAVDGHALAVSVLAGALADHPPTSDLRALQSKLETAGRTDVRVAHVLAYYGERLTVRDRLLVAIVSLFQRPIAPAAILTLGTHSALDEGLTGWSEADVEVGVRQRLTGLLSWHPNRTVSAHPLVRESYRSYVLTGQTVDAVSKLTLADLPTSGPVTSKEDALRVVEMIELLLDANQWSPADELYAARCSRGAIWRWLPAAKVGQRCAAAFVASPQRRERCEDRLPPATVSFFLNEVGINATNAGDMLMAEEFLSLAADYVAQHDLPGGTNAIRILINLSACLAVLGDSTGALRASERALYQATKAEIASEVRHARCRYAMALHLAGDTPAAEDTFRLADLTDVVQSSVAHYHSTIANWGTLRLNTGRVTAARELAKQNLTVATDNGWNAYEAQYIRLLGQCDLAEGHVESATRRLAEAARRLRDGDYLIAWTDTLPSLADSQRLAGNLHEADQTCTKALTAAGPRKLLLSQGRALAARSRVRIDRFVVTSDHSDIQRARDDADLALRLATKVTRLPWLELDALRTQAYIDERIGADGGWSAQVARSFAALAPSEDGCA
jgi:tetratricopeptide (TPR) repeat protein